MGALDLYQDRPGALTPRQRSDAVALAELIATTVIDLQAGAAPGALANEIDRSMSQRATFHQASGMLSVQLNIPMMEARARIRAHAYTRDRLLDDVARDIVSRRLVLAG